MNALTIGVNYLNSRWLKHGRFDEMANRQEQRQQTTDDPPGEPEQRDDGNVVTNVVQGASGGLVTLIDATEAVFSEAVHAVGRVGNAAIEEVFGLISSIAGGVSDTASAMFQGRRMPTRLERREPTEPERHTGP